MKVKKIIGSLFLILLILLLIFNTNTVPTYIFFWKVEIQWGVFILGTFGAGVLVGWLWGRFRFPKKNQKDLSIPGPPPPPGETPPG
jgi:uncharacterized integral membrane protein